MLKIVQGSPNLPALEYLATDSTTYTLGSLIYRDTTTGTVKEQTATVGDATTVEAITTKTQTTGTSTYIKAVPIVQGQYIVADCTNNTAANQLNKAHLFTDARTVNNTSTHSVDINAIFVALRIVGAAADKKLFGYIVKLGQVTA